jgi:hypothetical protein
MAEPAIKMPPLTLFDECVRDIEASYKSLGHKLGWRFLNVSRSVLDAPVEVALITINPAGDVIPPDHPWQSCETSPSHIVEKWHGRLAGQDVLEVQVKALFCLLSRTLMFQGSCQEPMAQSLISQFIPFRRRPSKLPSLDNTRRRSSDSFDS